MFPHLEAETEVNSQVSCHLPLRKHLRLQGVFPMAMGSRKSTCQQRRDQETLNPGPLLSLLDDPEVIGSREPTVEWETRSFGNSFRDTLLGWPPIMVHGVYPNRG